MARRLSGDRLTSHFKGLLDAGTDLADVLHALANVSLDQVQLWNDEMHSGGGDEPAPIDPRIQERRWDSITRRLNRFAGDLEAEALTYLY